MSKIPVQKFVTLFSVKLYASVDLSSGGRVSKKMKKKIPNGKEELLYGFIMNLASFYDFLTE